jgi:hypothetical protein
MSEHRGPAQHLGLEHCQPRCQEDPRDMTDSLGTARNGRPTRSRLTAGTSVSTGTSITCPLVLESCCVDGRLASECASSPFSLLTADANRPIITGSFFDFIRKRNAGRSGAPSQPAQERGSCMMDQLRTVRLRTDAIGPADDFAGPARSSHGADTSAGAHHGEVDLLSISGSMNREHNWSTLLIPPGTTFAASISDSYCQPPDSN